MILRDATLIARRDVLSQQLEMDIRNVIITEAQMSAVDDPQQKEAMQAHLVGIQANVTRLKDEIADIESKLSGEQDE